MTDDESLGAFLAVEACQSRSLGCAARSSGRPKPAGDPWAYLGAYSLRGPCAGFEACLDGRPVVGDGWEAPQENRPGRRRRHRFRCPSWAQVR